jgi:hypothetical protein
VTPLLKIESFGVLSIKKQETRSGDRKFTLFVQMSQCTRKFEYGRPQLWAASISTRSRLQAKLNLTLH